MSYMEIKHRNYTVQLEEPILYVDNKTRGRSGHMSHAMAEFSPNCFIDFNSNCSPVRWSGHSPYGWIEYRISEDGGKTYSPIQNFPYSVKSFEDGIYMISVEKAVACGDGSIVAFCLRNDGLDATCCEPWNTPTVVISRDKGKTWSDAKEFTTYKGRIYDAEYKDGIIYVMLLCNEHFTGITEDHVYRIFQSTDNGQSFFELAVLPIEPIGRNYGTMLFDPNGNLHAYAHNDQALEELDHAVSRDRGKTWTLEKPAYLKKGLRNPQIAYIDGVYILHGRSEDYSGLVIYTSEDGYNWDEGRLVVENKGAAAFYSNNINLSDEKGNFLLIQYSDRYFCDRFHTQANCRVNVMHMKLRIK